MVSVKWRPPIPRTLINFLRNEETSEGLNNVIHAAVSRGWSLTEIAEILGVTREAVRQRFSSTKMDVGKMLALTEYIDAKPPYPRPTRAPHPRPTPLDDVPEVLLEELRDLQAISSKCTGGAPVGDPRRLAGDELCASVNFIMETYGVSLYAIAVHVLGVTRQGLKYMMGRRGYNALPPSQQKYVYKNKQHTNWVDVERNV